MAQVLHIFASKISKTIEEYDERIFTDNIEDKAVRQLHGSFKMCRSPVPDELCWLTGESRTDYLHDMRICQRWAVLDRMLIAAILMDYLHLQESGIE